MHKVTELYSCWEMLWDRKIFYALISLDKIHPIEAVSQTANFHIKYGMLLEISGKRDSRSVRLMVKNLFRRACIWTIFGLYLME